MAGFDIELGYKIPVFDKYIDEVRAYGGGFHFAANGYDSITGPRARLDLRWNDLPCYGKGSRFSLGAEIQHDNVRQRTGFVIARLRLPLQTFKSKNSKYPRLSTLELRMTDSIERDIDIVAGKEKNPRVVDEPATITVDGKDISNVVLLDANDNVPVEITNAGVGATIILDGKAGMIDNGASSITPLDNQNILGAGIYVVGTKTGLSAPIGSRPILTANNSTDIFNISNIDNLNIKAIDIDGGNRALYISLSSGSTYDDISISNTTSDAISLNLISNNNIISNIYANNIGGNGISLSSSDNNLISNTIVTNSSGAGYVANSGSGNNVFSNITAINANNYGILNVQSNNNIYKDFSIINSSGYGIVSVIDTNTSYNNAIIKDSGQSGIYTLSASNISINNTIIENSTLNGMQLTGTTSVSGNNNTVLNSTNLECYASGTITGSIEYNNGSTCP